MRTRNNARRVVPLRGRGVPHPRTKKPTPSHPTAYQLEQIVKSLWTLVGTSEAAKVDGKLEGLLVALGLDPASQDAWRDDTLLLACLHYDIGKPPRTNSNARKMSLDDDKVLLREVIRLTKQGLTQEQAINVLASDEHKARLLKLKPMSSLAQRVETLRRRLSAIKKNSVGLENIFGRQTVTTVEKALTNLAVAEVRKNQTAF